MNRGFALAALVVGLSVVFTGWQWWRQPGVPVASEAAPVMQRGAEIGVAPSKVAVGTGGHQQPENEELLSYQLEQLLQEPLLEQQWQPDNYAVSTLREAAQNGDPRTPPLAPSPEREMPTAAELADPDAYLAYEARQQQAVYQSFIDASRKKIDQLSVAIRRAEAEGGVTDEQLHEGKEKLKRLEAMHAQVLQEHPEVVVPDDSPEP